MTACIAVSAMPVRRTGPIARDDALCPPRRVDALRACRSGVARMCDPGGALRHRSDRCFRAVLLKYAKRRVAQAHDGTPGDRTRCRAGRGAALDAGRRSVRVHRSIATYRASVADFQERGKPIRSGGSLGSDSARLSDGQSGYPTGARARAVVCQPARLHPTHVRALAQVPVPHRRGTGASEHAFGAGPAALH